MARMSDEEWERRQAEHREEAERKKLRREAVQREQPMTPAREALRDDIRASMDKPPVQAQAPQPKPTQPQATIDQDAIRDAIQAGLRASIGPVDTAPPSPPDDNAQDLEEDEPPPIGGEGDMSDKVEAIGMALMELLQVAKDIRDLLEDMNS